MKYEGFVQRALSVIKRKELGARWLANQAHFNGEDNQEIERNAKVAVIFSLNVLNSEIMVNQLDRYIDKAYEAQTLGEIRRIIDEVYGLMPDELNPV